MSIRNGTVIGIRNARALVLLEYGNDIVAAPVASGDGASGRALAEPSRVKAVNDPAAHVGDRVEVIVPEARGSGQLIPLLLVDAMAVLGLLAYGLTAGNEAAGIGIGIGLAAGIAGTALLGRRATADRWHRTRVLRVIDYAAGLEPCRICSVGTQRR